MLSNQNTYVVYNINCGTSRRPHIEEALRGNIESRKYNMTGRLKYAWATLVNVRHRPVGLPII